MTPYYDDGTCTIYHGDCREVFAQLVSVEHVITDPPYGRDVYLRMRSPDTHVGSGTPTRIGPGLLKMGAGAIGNIDDMLPDVAGDIARVTQRWALVFSDVETCPEWRRHLTRNHSARDGDYRQMHACPMRYVRTGIWVKPDAMPQMTGDRPAVGFEPCTICHALGPMRWNGGGRQAVWTYNTCKVDRPDHPCPKPLPLMLHLVVDFTDPGETILDPFMGSGTTLVAAKRLGRKAIGIELEEKYCEIAANRLRQGALDLFGEATA